MAVGRDRPRRRVRAGLVLAAALALGVGAWRLTAPPPQAAAPAGVAAVAPAAPERARREAALALARDPGDDPWTLAERAAPASAASAPDRERCGDDERPGIPGPADEDAPAAQDASRPAGPHYLAELRRIDAALRLSADPYDRAVADWLDIGDTLAPADRDRALVADAVATRDPRVYALAYRTCVAAGSEGVCGALSARRWAELDPGNAVPWAYVFAQAWQAGDASTQQEAMARMAASERFEDRFFAAAGAVVEHVPDDDPQLAAAASVVVRATGLSAAEMIPLSALTAACRREAGGDANLAQQCRDVADRMYEHSDTLLLRLMGGALYAQATGDETRREVARAEQVAFVEHWSPGTGFSPCGVARDLLRQARRGARLGELGALRERARQFVPP
jgi:hypothetical protein